jgi:signal peptidase
VSSGGRSRRLRAVELSVGLAVVAAWWLTAAPRFIGGPATYVVIRGDSMEPTYRTGDLVILRTSDAYVPGDIIGYRVPDGEVGGGRLVVHRIAGGDPEAGFVFLGDNNPAPDPWHPVGSDIAGRVWIAVPAVGRFVALLHQPAVAGALGAALIVAWLVLRACPVAGLPAAQALSRRRNATADVRLQGD